MRAMLGHHEWRWVGKVKDLPRDVVARDTLRLRLGAVIAGRGEVKIDEANGLAWLQNHLDYTTTPLLGEPWVLDMDSTVMGGATADRGSFNETIIFLSHFKDPEDTRQLLLCLLAVLAGGDTATDITLLGRKKLDMLRRFCPFAKRTPARDHLGDTLAALNPERFQRGFVAWVEALIGTPRASSPSLRDALNRQSMERTGRESLHRDRNAVQITSARPISAVPACPILWQPPRPQKVGLFRSHSTGQSEPVRNCI